LQERREAERKFPCWSSLCLLDQVPKSPPTPRDRPISSRSLSPPSHRRRRRPVAAASSAPAVHACRRPHDYDDSSPSRGTCSSSLPIPLVRRPRSPWLIALGSEGPRADQGSPGSVHGLRTAPDLTPSAPFLSAAAGGRRNARAAPGAPRRRRPTADGR
jgi:hypothetical protein